MVLAVVLDNNVWTFFPGQTISGNVVVTKNIWHKVEGLSIRFLGRMEFGSAASAPILPPRDTLPNYQQERSIFERFSRSPAHDIVLDHKMNLVHSWKVLKPGSHEFPFSFMLPDEDDLPESIKIEGFRVIYEFVVVLRRPRDDYKVYQTPFYVQNRFLESDLSASQTISKYSNDIALKTEDTIGFCMCCRSGPFGINFRVPRRIGYIGKDVDFIMEIWNDTSVQMDCAKILLVREFKHKKGIETKKKDVLSELAGPAVSSGAHEVWTTFFRIPANTPQTNFVRRDAFEINYFLKALLQPVDRTSNKISVKCPLLVILEDEQQITFASNPTESCNVQDVVNGAPPPSYAEVMRLDNASTSPLVE